MRLLFFTTFLLFRAVVVISQNAINLNDVTTEISFPYEISNDFILLDVKFNNVLPLKFLFDTGSEHCILFKREYSDLLGLTYQKRIPLLGSDLSQEVFGYIVRGVALNIQNTCLAQTDMLILEEDYLRLDELTGIKIDGMIGANIFRQFILYINNREQRITFIRPDKFKPPKKYMEFSIDVSKHKPYIQAYTRLAGQSEKILIRLLMDTGAALPLLIYTNTHDDLTLPPETITGNLGMGLGGFLEGYIGRLDLFEFGEYSYSNLITSFQEIPQDSIMGSDSWRNGILGNSILSRFNFYIDYFHEKLYIQPNRKYKKKFKFDRSGLLIVATGPNLHNFIVQKVLEDSPASEAGFEKGDVLTTLQRLPVNLFSLQRIISVLSAKEGKTIRITINRNGTKMKMKFELSDLI